jgi:hypothetical protein
VRVDDVGEFEMRHGKREVGNDAHPGLAKSRSTKLKFQFLIIWGILDLSNVSVDKFTCEILNLIFGI